MGDNPAEQAEVFLLRFDGKTFTVALTFRFLDLFSERVVVGDLVFNRNLAIDLNLGKATWALHACVEYANTSGTQAYSLDDVARVFMTDAAGYANQLFQLGIFMADQNAREGIMKIQSHEATLAHLKAAEPKKNNHGGRSRDTSAPASESR